MKLKSSMSLDRTTSSNEGVGHTPPTRLALGLFTGVLTVACLPQASLSAQASALLFGHDYDIANFGVTAQEEVINATTPDGGGQTGSFQLGRVERIDRVSIELSHSARGFLNFLLRAPNGSRFSFMDRQEYRTTPNIFTQLNDLGDGGSDLAGLATYEFTESTGPAIASVAANPTPAGAHRAVTWLSAPTGGWAPGTWTLFLIDYGVGRTGAVRRIEVHGVVVPEPSAYALIVGLFAFAGVALRRRVR